MPTSYKLSEAAEAALDEIATYTDDAFGTWQTEAYLAGFTKSFELLVMFPGIGVAVFEIKSGLRRYRYQSHYIFYTEQTDGVLIEHIIHTRRNIRADLFDT